jgi:hypothetical protein
MEFESEILPIGNPDSGKKQHALASTIEVERTKCFPFRGDDDPIAIRGGRHQ